MIVGGYDRNGRPTVRGLVTIHGLGVQYAASFLVDTGADRTCLHYPDVPLARAGSRLLEEVGDWNCTDNDQPRNRFGRHPNSELRSPQTEARLGVIRRTCASPGSNSWYWAYLARSATTAARRSFLVRSTARRLPAYHDVSQLGPVLTVLIHEERHPGIMKYVPDPAELERVDRLWAWRPVLRRCGPSPPRKQTGTTWGCPATRRLKRDGPHVRLQRTEMPLELERCQALSIAITPACRACPSQISPYRNESDSTTTG